MAKIRMIKMVAIGAMFGKDFTLDNVKVPKDPLQWGNPEAKGEPLVFEKGVALIPEPMGEKIPSEGTIKVLGMFHGVYPEDSEEVKQFLISRGPTLDQVKEALKAFAEKHSVPAMQALVKEHAGVERVSEAKPETYAAVYAAASKQ